MRAPDYFARFVLEATGRMDRVCCYEQGGPHVSLIWPEMAEAQWRDAALNAINKDLVAGAQFLEPNAGNSWWVFLAHRAGARASLH